MWPIDARQYVAQIGMIGAAYLSLRYENATRLKKATIPLGQAQNSFLDRLLLRGMRGTEPVAISG